MKFVASKPKVEESTSTSRTSQGSQQETVTLGKRTGAKYEAFGSDGGSASSGHAGAGFGLDDVSSAFFSAASYTASAASSASKAIQSKTKIISQKAGDQDLMSSVSESATKGWSSFSSWASSAVVSPYLALRVLSCCSLHLRAYSRVFLSLKSRML